jgi:hypothetical protein
MPERKATPAEIPSAELVLAAIERAERHRRPGREPGVHRSTIADHLGLTHNSWTTRRIRPRLEDLHASGDIEWVRRKGVIVWRITTRGRRRVGYWRRAGKTPDLPEAPQHRIWREARESAAERISGLRDELHDALESAAALLTNEDADSDAWFAIAERLDVACRRIGAATFRLCEWREPNDATADTQRERRGSPEGRW